MPNYNPSKSLIYRDLTLLIACIGSALVFWGLPALQYRSDADFQTKTLMAIAGQFAHMSTQHLGLNLLGLLLLAWGFAPWRTCRQDTLFLSAGLVGVALGLLTHPEVHWYKGLSGALHGLFLGYATHVFVCDKRTPVKWVALVLIGGTGLKLWLELNQPGLVSGVGNSTEPVLHAAHRWGAAAGLVAGLASALLKQLRNRPQKRPA